MLRGLKIEDSNSKDDEVNITDKNNLSNKKDLKGRSSLSSN